MQFMECWDAFIDKENREAEEIGLERPKKASWRK
jgi:hypothetical protein